MDGNVFANTTNIPFEYRNVTTFDHLEYKVAERILSIYPPILLLFGLTGNFMTIHVLSQSNKRSSSTVFLLIFLAVTDSVILLCSVLVKWIGDVFKINLRNYSYISCKVHVFFTYLTLQLSAWILVFISLERYICVRCPIEVRAIVTTKRIAVTMTALVLTLSILNGHFLYGVNLEYNELLYINSCSVQKEHEYFMFKIWPWIDFSLAFAIPFCVFVVCNTLIFMNLKSSQAFRRRSCVMSVHQISPRCETNRTSRYFTKTALILNVTFVVLVSPSVIFGIGQPYWFPLGVRTPQRDAQLILIGVLVHMLMYTNNSINFILYVLIGDKFRRDVLRLCPRST